MKANERKGASSVNPETWCDFETAQKAVSDGIYDHIGFVFNNNGIVGIDIDCGFDELFIRNEYRHHASLSVIYRKIKKR